jgi:hypothetical protein
MLLRVLSLLVALVLSGCVTPPDSIVCTNLSDQKGWCTTMISGKSSYVDASHPFGADKLKWADVVNSSVIVPAESWVEIKNFIDSTCHQSGKCGSNVGNWSTTLQSIDTHVSATRKVKSE